MMGTKTSLLIICFVSKIEQLNTTKTTKTFIKYSNEFEIFPSYKYKDILKTAIEKTKNIPIRKIL